MRALSIKQPWASLIVGGPLSPGVKETENRGRALAKWAERFVGQDIAIHASKKRDEDAFRDILDGCFAFDLRKHELPYVTIREFPTGAIIGVATLGRVFGPGESLTAAERRFYVGGGTFGLRFDGARWFAPIACNGALGFWTVPEDVERQVHEQIARAS